MKKIYISAFVFLIFISGLCCAEFYRTNSENYSLGGFDPIPVREEGVRIIAEDMGRLPFGHFNANNSSFMVRPEGNQNAGDKGAFVYAYEAEEPGNYIIDISLSNVGTDVKGGDGGQTECYAQKKGDSMLDNLLFSFPVPISGDSRKVGDKKEIYLEKGDKIYIVFKANYDGFGDQFEGKLSIINRDAKPVFEKESQIVPLNDFRFYRTHSSDPRINRFAEMDQRAEGETFFAGDGYVPPILTFGNKKYEWTVRPEGDQLVSDRKGSVIGVWDCPEDGNFEISTKITNIGLDVFGGDGGSFRLYKTSPDSEYMSAVVYSFPIPISVQGEKPCESAQKIIKMKKGEKLLFQFIAGIDAYADQFLTEISINKTDKEGEVINDLGLDNYLAQMPETKKVSPIKIRKGIWLGMGLLDGEYRDRSADLWKKYLGDITVSPVCDNPRDLKYKDTDYMDYYNSRNIAVIPQTWGPFYQPYLIFNNGLEYL
ncbi:MAG: hypothetical protein KBT47_05420 [Armatimonadetes bacterium]|nr:hypothetical protein [Candidatus Hippobium faecium]